MTSDDDRRELDTLKREIDELKKASLFDKAEKAEACVTRSLTLFERLLCRVEHLEGANNDKQP